MAPKTKHPMKRSQKLASGQFTLALDLEPSPHLDATRKEEVLKVLSDLLLEAVGMEPAGSQVEKEESDES
jgi:hypothetical protein